jgi:hypothetical protein
MAQPMWIMADSERERRRRAERTRGSTVLVLALSIAGCQRDVQQPTTSAGTAKAPEPTRASTPEKRAEPAPAVHTVAIPARWELGTKPHPPRFAGLAFGMSFEKAADAQPALRDGMNVVLDPMDFDDLAKRRPDLHLLDDPMRLGSGGNRFRDFKSLREKGLSLDGAQWKIRFSTAIGLESIFLKFDDETSMNAAIGPWGKPDIAARWKVWTDPSTHTRAAFTACDYAAWNNDAPVGKRTCTVELMPMQTPKELVRSLFPAGKTRVGATAFGDDVVGQPFRSDDDQMTAFLLPLPAALWTPVEMRVDASKTITAYRSQLAFTYDGSARDGYLAALAEVMGPDVKNVGHHDCAKTTIDGQPVSACEDGATAIVVTIGDWSLRHRP